MIILYRLLYIQVVVKLTTQKITRPQKQYLTYFHVSAHMKPSTLQLMDAREDFEKRVEFYAPCVKASVDAPTATGLC